MSTPIKTSLRVLSEVSPPAATWIAERLWLRPPRSLRPARELSVLRQAEPLGLRAAGLDLAAWSWGQGPAVLLVHGWAGRGAQLASFVAPLVHAGYRVVTFDAPAHGDSPGKEASIAELTEAVEEAAWRVGPLHAVIAHSFGAMATSVAVLRGVPVDRLVYVAPAVFTPSTAGQVANALGVNRDVMARLTARVEARLGIGFAELQVDRIAPRIDKPLLILHDESDREVPLERSLLLARSWSGSALRVTQGLGHRRLLGDPGLIEAAVHFVRTGGLGSVRRPDPWAELVGSDAWVA